MIPKRCAHEVCEEDGANNQLDLKVKLGDMIWVKPDGHLWWPAQVYDENAVGESSKPGKRSVGEVFVRFYGSYTFSYVNPTKYTLEFENTLKKNDGNYRKILQISMDKKINISKCRPKTQELFVRSSKKEKLNEKGTGRKEKVRASNSTRLAAVGLSRARASTTSSVAKNGEKANASLQAKSGANLRGDQNPFSSKKKQNSKVPGQGGVHTKVKKEDPGCSEELKCESSAIGRALGKCKLGRQIAEVEEDGRSSVKKLKPNTPSVGEAKPKTSEMMKRLEANSSCIDKGEATNKKFAKGKTSIKRKPDSQIAEVGEEKKSRVKKLKQNTPSVDEGKPGTMRRVGVQNQVNQTNLGEVKISREEVLEELKPTSARSKQGGKRMASKQVMLQRKQKLGSPVPKQQAKRRTSNKDLDKKKLQMKATVTKEVKKNSPQMEPPLINPTRVMTPKEAQESSARKMRVMQVLGLVPPIGSPFP